IFGRVSKLLGHRRSDCSWSNRAASDLGRSILDGDLARQRLDSALRGLVAERARKASNGLERADVDNRARAARGEKVLDGDRAAERCSDEIGLDQASQVALARGVCATEDVNASVVDPARKSTQPLGGLSGALVRRSL